MKAPPSPGGVAAPNSARSTDKRPRHDADATPAKQDLSFLDDAAEPVETEPRWQFKYQRILASFLTGRSWHTLEAVRGLHTTCLHSDVSSLEKRGLRFNHERITVPGYAGTESPVMRYTLRPESYAQARALLGLATPSGEPEADAIRDYRKASGA
ncbi:MAG: hypothetical protein MUE59_02695 [Thiobacillaceae bacterium]|jgi:hypothetical protein|nr:hypothetical protein [Thiobacillaceae bacterium]